MVDWNQKILAYALKNAIDYNGKANANTIVNSLFHEGLKKQDLEKVLPLIRQIVGQVNAMTLEQQKKEFESLYTQVSERKIRVGLPELPNAKQGKVVTRFAPYPSGPLHIGNTRILVLNNEYAKMYKGKMLFIIDDTIGSEEKQIVKEAYELIPEGLKLMGVKYSRIFKKSSRLKIYYKYAEMLIKKGKAYVCECSIDELRKNRKEGRECSCRQYPPKEQMKRWKEMFKKSAKQGKYALRIKTNMQDPDPAFRDRVIFRISTREHPLVGKKYKVWPMLEISWAVDDHLLGITHVIRGKELMIETKMEKYIFGIFGWKEPEFIHTGLLGFEGIKLSKSKGQKEVREGRYAGWDDPRTWSIQSLIKRGIEPEALKKFILSLGIRQTEITVPIDILYTENRKLLNQKAKPADFKPASDLPEVPEIEPKIPELKQATTPKQKTPQKTKQISNAKVIMPDGSTINGSTSVQPKSKDIIYFRDFGYCKFDQKKQGKLVFYFAHK